MDITALTKKRADFIRQRKENLDKIIARGRELTAEERVEDKRLEGEIKRMDELITMARGIASADVPPPRGARIDDGSREIPRGLVGNWEPRGYQTSHQTLGEFVRDCAVPTERRDMSMMVGSAGGFVVPDQLLQQVLMAPPEDSIIAAACTTIGPMPGAPDAACEIPALDQSGARGPYGGVQLAWLGEGGPKPQTEPELRQIKLEPEEIAGHVVISDKLIRNAGQPLDTFLRKVLGSALAGAQEQTFVNGTGGAQPWGILGHAATINVARAGAGAIAYADLVGMIARFGPSTWGKGFWMVSQSALPALLTMADPGAGGTLVIRPSELQGGKPPSLLGFPLYVTTRQPVLGATGDLMLIEPSYYLRKLGFGPAIEVSNGPLFTQNQSIIKVFGNVDGAPWLNGPILMHDGVTTLSPFVALAA